MDPVELSLFSSRINSVCEEMGAVLKRTAFSPNIKDRLDFSCAIFDPDGQLCAQAAHIPVHLGSMAYAMKDIVRSTDWLPGEMVVLNDPFRGGTHLPDVTIIAPFFIDDHLCGFVANRAHHADIGSETPGSMPLATRLADEGLIIAPTRIYQQNSLIESTMSFLLEDVIDAVTARGDFSAQISANLCGLNRLTEVTQPLGRKSFNKALFELNNYAEKLALSRLELLPAGEYSFCDFLDDDGQGNQDLRLSVSITLASDSILVDFTGSSDQTSGNLNCPLSVTAAAVYYVFYCLLPKETPACSGCFRPIRIMAPEKSLINAQSPAAVAAGNVETSTRIVDAILGALAKVIPDQIPAASHGSMNNIAMGNSRWAYYETLGGGMGASSSGPGQYAVQTHMTNTLNTPVEVLELTFPLRITRYAIRDGSHGSGLHDGGDGLIREYQFLEKCSVTLITERRRHNPWGLAGGENGKAGINMFNTEIVPPKVQLSAIAGDRLTIFTPGGGGWGTNSP